MESLFSTTTVLLSSEYVTQFPIENLMGKLRKVRKETGITFKKVKKTFALVGTFDMVQEAFNLLKLWLEDPTSEPLGDCTIGEFEQIEMVQNEILWNNAQNVVAPFTASSSIAPDLTSLQEHLINVDKIKQEIEEGIVTLESRCVFTNMKEISPNAKSDIDGIGKDCFEDKSQNETKVTKSAPVPFENHGNGTSVQISKSRVSKDEAVKFVQNVVKEENKRDVKRKPQSSVKRTLEDEKLSLKMSWQKGKKKKNNSSVDQNMQCSTCQVVLKSRKRLNEHIKRIHLRQFKCSVCERRFGYPTDLHRHKCHGKPEYNQDGSIKLAPKKAKMPELLPCKECNYMATSKKRYNEHVKRKHKLNYKCDVCDKYFGFMKDLTRHKERVHSEPSHFCDKCSRFYKSKALYDLHMKTHEEGYVKPNFSCQICHKSFTTKYVMATHIKSEHLGMKKTFQCSQCGKKFNQRNSYKMHMNAHQGIKPYVCDLCGKAFTYDKSLKEHKYMHDTVKRFHCELCSKTFRQKTTLHIHMKVHTAAKDHVCKTCGRGFNQKQALERHGRIHTGLKPYTCLLCKRSFGDASTIRRHMLAIHKKAGENWRDDIIAAPKPKSDYYIEGGSGHNRTYTRKTTLSTNRTNAKKKEKGKQLNSHATEQEQYDTHEDHVPQRNINCQPEFIPEQYQGQMLSIQQQESAMEETSHQLQNVYSNTLPYNNLPTVVAEPEHRHLDNEQHDKNLLPAYNIPADYVSNMHSHNEGVLQDEMLINSIYQQRQLPQNSICLPIIAPLSGVADIPVTEQQQAQAQPPGDSILSQAMSNIWGHSTYPSYSLYVNPATYTAFQDHQNC